MTSSKHFLMRLMNIAIKKMNIAIKFQPHTEALIYLLQLIAATNGTI